MSDSNDLDDLSPEQRAQLADFEKRLEDAKTRILGMAAPHLQALGKILRRSVEHETLAAFKRFLLKHQLWNGGIARNLALFRDFLILSRIDLKDLEPAARARLRTYTLRAQDADKMTPDYRAGYLARADMRCRDCKYFVTAPHDQEPNGDKSCVELGTKGADRACYGYTLPPN